MTHTLAWISRKRSKLTVNLFALEILYRVFKIMAKLWRISNNLFPRFINRRPCIFFTPWCKIKTQVYMCNGIQILDGFLYIYEKPFILLSTEYLGGWKKLLVCVTLLLIMPTFRNVWIMRILFFFLQ